LLHADDVDVTKEAWSKIEVGIEVLPLFLFHIETGTFSCFATSRPPFYHGSY